MALTLTRGDIQHGSTFRSSQTFAGSTATAFQVIDRQADVVFIGMGTATSDNSNNLYSLTSTATATDSFGDAVEGHEIVLVATATGEAAIFVEHPTQGRLPLAAMILIDAAATGDISVTMASATGNWVFQGDGDMLFMKFMNGTWNFVSGHGATMATAT